VIYLIPETGVMDEISNLASRTGIPLHNPRNLRDFILSTSTDPIAIVAVDEDIMLILSRHAVSIFPDELPVVLQSVPGLIYQPGWASMGTVFPPAHFRDFEEMTKRSGVLSTNAVDLESRGRGTRLLNNRTASAMSPDTDTTVPEEDDHDEAVL